MKGRILIVEDEPAISRSLKIFLESKGYEVHCEESFQKAKSFSRFRPDLAIVDLNLPDGRGTDLIEQLRQKDASLQALLITAEVSVNTNIVEAVKNDIFYFIAKPFELSVLLKLTEKALSQKELIRQNENLKANIRKQYRFDQMIGQSEALLKVTDLMRKTAQTSSTLLITGESGTGKELVARSVHCARDGSAPFVSVNCGAIPKDLMESEFFGHAKGAFTGALYNRKGRFEMAEGGTLFLDEIGTMDLHLQVKLLRVLQEKEFEPVGECRPIPCNVRVIAAANMDLEKAVERGAFREDLYYRLNIIPVSIPPLRERKEDIPLLLNHFIKVFNKGKDSKITGISEEAMESLCHYFWPGNIREMENLVERLSVLKTGGRIEFSDLPEKYRLSKNQSMSLSTVSIPSHGVDFNEAVNQYENAILMKVLEKTNWNRRRAAALLNLNRTTLVEKLKKKGLKPPEGLPDEKRRFFNSAS